MRAPVSPSQQINGWTAGLSEPRAVGTCGTCSDRNVTSEAAQNLSRMRGACTENPSAGDSRRQRVAAAKIWGTPATAPHTTPLPSVLASVSRPLEGNAGKGELPDEVRWARGRHAPWKGGGAWWWWWLVVPGWWWVVLVVGGEVMDLAMAWIRRSVVLRADRAGCSRGEIAANRTWSCPSAERSGATRGSNAETSSRSGKVAGAGFLRSSGRARGVRGARSNAASDPL